MTRLVRFSNNAISKLASAITSSSTTITLQAGDGLKFPALAGSQFFMGTLVKSDGSIEVVKVTARTGDTLTVVRAAEAVAGVQTAYAFAINDRFEHRLTAKAVGDELDRLDQAALINPLNKSSNYTLTAQDVTSLVRVNTSGGAVTITLPDISTLANDYDCIVAKVTGDTNIVTVARSGSDTINGATTYAITSQWQGAWLTADRSTNTWTVIASGGSGVRAFVDSFTGSGTAGPFTLSGDPGVKENTAVYVDGVYQQKSTYTLVGTSLTVGGNVPAGVGVEVVWAQPLQMGVTTANLTTANDGASGSLFTTVQGAITRLLSSAGSAMVGFIQAGTGAVQRTLQDQARELVSRNAFDTDVNFDSARSAKSGRNDMVVRPSSFAADMLLSDALAQAGLAQIGRSSPHTNFAWFTSDFTVTQCGGPGRAALAQDIADVFQTKFGASLGITVSYVHPNGSDGNAGTSWRSAFLTLAQALRSTTNGTIYVWPGTYALSDFRYTDSYGGQPKKVIAPFGGVTLRVPGDAASAATWILDGDYGGMYTMCIASSNKPMRLLRSDLLDKYGNKVPMPLFADRIALASQNFGWCYEASKTVSLNVSTSDGSNVLTVVSGGTKQATVGMAITGTGIPGGATITAVSTNATVTISANATATNASITATATGNLLTAREAMSANINTTTKANMDIVYADSSGDMRTLLYSTTSYWEGFNFYGYISVLNASGQATPQFWAKNCTFSYGPTHSLLVEGGYAYTQDCVSRYSSADGANYNVLNGITARGVEINYKTYYAGDVLTFGTAMTLNPQGTGTNKNGSSNHDSYVVRVNGEHYDCYGPNIADTATSYSWCLGVKTGYNAIAPNSIPASPRYGILMQGNNAWLDGCSATGVDAGFNSDSSASVRVFNCAGTQSATAGGTFATYYPPI